MLPTTLEGARTHNLKEVDLRLRPGELVVVTGVSGAGKSSLAVDTLYAEGQRRFVESFSPYARQFLERLERPPMKRLEPVPAAVAVDRRAPVKSSRSTVATMADLEPYLAALFVREALPVCPDHGLIAVEQDPTAAADRVSRELADEPLLVTYRIPVGGAEAYLETRERLVQDGYRRLRVGDELTDVDSLAPSKAVSAGAVEVVVDRVRARAGARGRIVQALEAAWQRGAGQAMAHAPGRSLALTRGLSCPRCGQPLEPARPGRFSYESPLGACGECRGFGRTIGVDLHKVVPDPSKSLKGRAVRPWGGKSTRWERAELAKLCRRHDIPMDVPWRELSAAQQKLVIEGDGSWHDGLFPGVLGWFAWLETKIYKMHVRVLLSRYRSYDQCVACKGSRLNERALSYRVAGRNLAEWHAMEVRDARAALDALVTSGGHGELARRELSTRLAYLERVGLGYLTLARQARTLSGGEAQRVTLTAALGTSLENALFVLDEPTVGLHPADVAPLTVMLRALARRGNVVLVVEHDPQVIAAADRVVELGPGAGQQGGRVTFDGTPAEAARHDGATARALSGAAAPRAERSPSGELTVRDARANNLKQVDVRLPLGVITAVTGPSGSGKSSLAVDIVYRALARGLGSFDVELPGEHRAIDGAAAVRRITLVDQAPLGRTSRGNAATYTKAWDTVRAAFATEPEAQARGLTAAHFSFNVEGGRCPACRGEGHETVEMQFLADVRLVCPACRGRRFQDGVLSVRHRGRSIAGWLDTTVHEALESFADVAAIRRSLGPLDLLGLGYLTLGQPLSTLSGGEAQRLKLARALADDHRGALFVLDEPSAGLHADEVAHLLAAFRAIVKGGGSVIVVEHDLDLIRHADWVVDLGPGAGRDGGTVVAEGSPDSLAAADTVTGRALSARARAPVAPAQAADIEVEETRKLTVTRAREHNLREVSVQIPHGALTVVTGPSGSGKSTLAFDVVFAEGQRRFLETLTPYARQFLPTMPRPDVDAVTGVPPAIALEQRTARAGAKSTVATVTEVAHYLRLLFAKLGTPHCPDHDEPIASRTPDELFDVARATRGKVSLLAPVVRSRKGLYLDVFTAAARDGIEHAWCDGELVSTDDPPRLARGKEHTIDLVLSAPVAAKCIERKAFERALHWGSGAIKLRHGKSERLLSLASACPRCGLSVPELDPRWFSFATEQGKCPACDGQGVVERAARKKRGRAPPPMVEPCAACGGSRLAPVPRAVRLQGQRYGDVTAHSVADAREWVDQLRFSGDAATIAKPVLSELSRRLAFSSDVGLDYLTLDRSARSLSGGEMQRLRLAAQLGAGLTGALFVLDEPTIGLHPRDTARLLRNLEALVATGSTLLVVEHDADSIRAAQHLIDLGPRGGTGGGQVVAAGAPAVVLSHPESPTARALSAPARLRPALPVPKSHPRLELHGARENNLRAVDLALALRRFNVVAGVSGSGKSTLIRQVLLPALQQELGLAGDVPGRYDTLRGSESLKRAVAVDQSPIGRTPRSVPATFLGIWDAIRRLFAATPDAQVAGFDAARFSFNTSAGGRCPACEGQGVTTHEMSFLPDVVTPCAACGGQRFEPQTLEVRYAGASIGDVLDLTAEQGAAFFAAHPNIAAPLATLVDLGAGYIRLGQGSHTLSGGEAQRLKLATELTASKRHEPTLYVLDEPTTGLHLADVDKLITVLSRLVERGDTLVVIEHHPQVIAGADWVVELGPGGGRHGGRVVAQGPPAVVARRKTATASVIAALTASSAA